MAIGAGGDRPALQRTAGDDAGRSTVGSMASPGVWGVTTVATRAIAAGHPDVAMQTLHDCLDAASSAR